MEWRKKKKNKSSEKEGGPGTGPERVPFTSYCFCPKNLKIRATKSGGVSTKLTILVVVGLFCFSGMKISSWTLAPLLLGEHRLSSLIKSQGQI